MKKKLWFRAKTYGWGWYPVTWQGWTATAFYIFYQLFLVALIRDALASRAGIVSYLFLTAIGIAALLAVCYQFGETPKWRWGNKK